MALSVGVYVGVLIVLIGIIATVMVLKSAKKSGPTPSPTYSPGPTPSPGTSTWLLQPNTTYYLSNSCLVTSAGTSGIAFNSSSSATASSTAADGGFDTLAPSARWGDNGAFMLDIQQVQGTGTNQVIYAKITNRGQTLGWFPGDDGIGYFGVMMPTTVFPAGSPNAVTKMVKTSCCWNFYAGPMSIGMTTNTPVAWTQTGGHLTQLMPSVTSTCTDFLISTKGSN